MLPLHQWRIRYADAYLKEGGDLYHAFILYQIFWYLSNFFKKNCLAVLYPHCLLRSRGTCIAHYACRICKRFSYPHRPMKIQCLRWQLPTTQALISFGALGESNVKTEEGISLLRPKKPSYQYSLTSTHQWEGTRYGAGNHLFYSPTDLFRLKRRGHAEHSLFIRYFLTLHIYYIIFF